MSQVPATGSPMATPSTTVPVASLRSENSARSVASARDDVSASASTRAPMPRSCMVCRSRKVRCDKMSPCSNCRRANIACVLPATNRPPRWARRLELSDKSVTSNAQTVQESEPSAASIMERLQNLENLVKELSGQSERADPAADSAAAGNPPESSRLNRNIAEQAANANAGNVQKQFGRLVLQDANRGRYVTSGFWSRVHDELDGIRTESRGLGSGDSDPSDDEAPFTTTQELNRAPSERHAFLFRHNLSLSTVDLREFHPLPSQVPFLLDMFSENVNSILRIVHVPTIAKMVRGLRGNDMMSLTPANKALMFSIYYAAITSMEDDDVVTNFGLTKANLNLKYRLGLEHALAQADFLHVPDLVLVQAFAIFLCLLRRYDSPRFVWMMTGLLIRMGHALGLHRDGAHLNNFTPFEIEMRRRTWWVLCTLDVRASEDQGSDFSILRGSFNTKLPLNINDADIEPGTAEMPAEREGFTDMTFTLVTVETSDITRQMVSPSAKEDAPGIEEQARLLGELHRKLAQSYLQYPEGSGNVAYWVAVTVSRLMMAKMTLFIYLPTLFSSPNEHFSEKIRTKLLVAAIEIAECNHALNAEEACRHWRWVFQTYTHWYAVVYILIEISRRPWSPLVERAWVALHSQWLVPPQTHMDKNMRFWVPLRKLTIRARKHRDTELERLRRDSKSAKQLEKDDQMDPVPASPGPFSAESNVADLYRERWRRLLMTPDKSGSGTRPAVQSSSGIPSPSTNPVNTNQLDASSMPVSNVGGLESNTFIESAHPGATGPRTSHNRPNNNLTDLQSVVRTSSSGDFTAGRPAVLSHDAVPSDSTTSRPGFVPWLWDDGDLSAELFANVDEDAMGDDMDLDGEVDLYDWTESANTMEWNPGPGGDRRA